MQLSRIEWARKFGPLFSLRISPLKRKLLPKQGFQCLWLKAAVDSQEHDGTKSQLNGRRHRHNLGTVFSSSHVVFSKQRCFKLCSSYSNLMWLEWHQTLAFFFFKLQQAMRNLTFTATYLDNKRGRSNITWLLLALLVAHSDPTISDKMALRNQTASSKLSYRCDTSVNE